MMLPVALSREKSVPGVDPLSLISADVVLAESSDAAPLTLRVAGVPVLPAAVPSWSLLLTRLSAPTFALGLATSVALPESETPLPSVPLTEPGMPEPLTCRPPSPVTLTAPTSTSPLTNKRPSAPRPSLPGRSHRACLSQ